MYKIKGVLFSIGEKMEFKSNMTKKDFVITRTDSVAYPHLVFEILGNDIPKLDAVAIGTLVEITFEIHGKSYSKDGKSRVYNALRAYNIEVVGSTTGLTMEVVSK